MNKIINNNSKSFIETLISNNFGFGKKIGLKFCKISGLNYRINPKNFKRKQTTEIAKRSQIIISGKKLKENNKGAISFLSRTKTYRGVRHKLKYPARGQRTHTNAKTKKKFKY